MKRINIFRRLRFTNGYSKDPLQVDIVFPQTFYRADVFVIHAYKTVTVLNNNWARPPEGVSKHKSCWSERSQWFALSDCFAEWLQSGSQAAMETHWSTFLEIQLCTRFVNLASILPLPGVTNKQFFPTNLIHYWAERAW